jgi:CheY-like chemotaxis protein
VLIIEDETLIALDLEGLLENLGHRVMGIARTHAEAVAIAKKKRLGLILADSGFSTPEIGFFFAPLMPQLGSLCELSEVGDG